MTVLILCGGSPGGITSSVCSDLTERLDDAVLFHCDGIGHCKGCGHCKEGGCVIRDGMDAIMDAYSGSDTIILATPLRFNGPSSQLKTMMDRFQPLWHNPDGKRRRLFLLITAGSPEPQTPHTEGIARAFAFSMGCEYCGSFVIADTDSDDWHSAAEKVLDALVNGI